jgi:hypothetical protein
MIEALRLLAGRQQDDAAGDVVLGQRARERFQVKPRHGLVGDDGQPRAVRASGDFRAGRFDEAGADENIVGPRAQWHMNNGRSGVFGGHRNRWCLGCHV